MLAVKGLFSISMRSMCQIHLSKLPPIPVFGVEGRYVSALYSAASQKSQLEEVEKHFMSLRTMLVKPKIIDFIETSMISRTEKAKLLDDAAKAAGMPETAKNFLVIVAENGRLKKLRKMVTLFLEVMVAHRQEAHCEVITAKPLSDANRNTLLEALNKFLAGKKVTLTEKVNPDIIGGIVVGIEDKHVDLSIARKIHMYTEILKQAV